MLVSVSIKLTGDQVDHILPTWYSAFLPLMFPLLFHISFTLLPCSVFSALFNPPPPPPPEHPVDIVSFSSQLPHPRTVCWDETYCDILCNPGCLLGKQHSETWESHSFHSEADGISGRDRRCHHQVHQRTGTSPRLKGKVCRIVLKNYLLTHHGKLSFNQYLWPNTVQKYDDAFI